MFPHFLQEQQPDNALSDELPVLWQLLNLCVIFKTVIVLLQMESILEY